MGDYTTIDFAPINRAWIAPPDFIYGVAAMLGASTVRFFNVERESSALHDAKVEEDEDENERFETVFFERDLPLEKAMREHRAGDGYHTHMIFLCGDFMDALTKEVIASLPESLSCDYVPWSISICNGHWQSWSNDTGKCTGEGACCFSMSADGRPADEVLYLEKFLEVAGIKQLKARLELLSGQPWTAIISVT